MGEVYDGVCPCSLFELVLAIASDPVNDFFQSLALFPQRLLGSRFGLFWGIALVNGLLMRNPGEGAKEPDDFYVVALGILFGESLQCVDPS